MYDNTAQLQQSPLFKWIQSDILAQNCSLWFPDWFLMKLLFVTACAVALSLDGSLPRHPWYRCFGCKEQAHASVLEEQKVAVGLTGD